VKLLCLADLHLGRRPSSRLPDDLTDLLPALGPAQAWRDAVDVAVRRGVDAVLIAGDVVEQDDDFYEAYRELRTGAERLTGAGIEVVAVAGNHDGEVLPRLVEQVPGVTLLGAGGRWERQALHGRDGVTIDVVGWSMPAATYPRSPLETGPAFARRRPTLGLLHGDRDGSGSAYAPFSSADLRATDVDAWLLGHVHAPDAPHGDRPIVYLGSPVGTDPGEPGPHGPWLLRVDAAGRLELEHLPIAPLRWEEATVDVTGLADARAFEDTVVEALEALEERIARAAHRPRAVGARLILRGRTAIGRELRAAADPERLRDAAGWRNGTRYFVHGVRDEMQPARAVEELARGADPAALLARRIVALRAGGEARSALIEAARPRLEAVHAGRPFRHALDAGPLEDDAVAELLERAAVRALDELLAQRSGA
jgi:predicted phosphodiesterase